MSSFVGHVITATAIFVSDKHVLKNRRWREGGWLLWLSFAAVAPDLDYIVPFLAKANHDGLRVSHSVLFALIIPVITMGCLLIIGVHRRTFFWRSAQILLAGLSHLLLDFLVGVHPMPLFFPIITTTYRSPIGLLPSAGTPRFDNIYFYRNLCIELGILIPLFIALQQGMSRRVTKKRIVTIGVCLVVAIGCVYVASTLAR